MNPTHTLPSFFIGPIPEIESDLTAVQLTGMKPDAAADLLVAKTVKTLLRKTNNPTLQSAFSEAWTVPNGHQDLAIRVSTVEARQKLAVALASKTKHSQLNFARCGTQTTTVRDILAMFNSMESKSCLALSPFLTAVSPALAAGLPGFCRDLAKMTKPDYWIARIEVLDPTFAILNIRLEGDPGALLAVQASVGKQDWKANGVQVAQNQVTDRQGRVVTAATGVAPAQPAPVAAPSAPAPLFPLPRPVGYNPVLRPGVFGGRGR